MKCADDAVKTKLCPGSLGFALGIIKGVCMLAIAWSAWLFGYGGALADHLASFYHGFGPSLVGGVIGFVWGFVWGFIFGFVLAWIYNYCLGHCSRKESQ